jgi:hypothetical protein
LEQDKASFFYFQVELVLNKLEKSKPCRPRVSVSRTDGAQITLTAFRQWRPLPCPCPRPCHRYFPDATPSSSTFSGSYKGAHPHRGAPFLPPPPFSPHCAAIPAAAELPRTARSSLSPTNSTTPRAPRRRVQPPAPWAVYDHPRMPPPPLFPSGRPHLIIELVLPMSLFLPAALKWVHHPTSLLPRPSPLHLATGRRRNPTR